MRKLIQNDCNKDDIIDRDVSIDVSCQRRGFSPLNGVAVVTCHGNTEVIDIVDTGSFTKVVESKPHVENLIPVKLEYVNPYQKRAGT